MVLFFASTWPIEEAIRFDIGDVIAAFSEDHVYRLTGLSKGRLRYWDKTGFFAPTYTDKNRHVPNRSLQSIPILPKQMCLPRSSTIKPRSRAHHFPSVFAQYTWTETNHNGMPDSSMAANLANSFKDGCYKLAPR
jgi:hypothetical protein